MLCTVLQISKALVGSLVGTVNWVTIYVTVVAFWALPTPFNIHFHRQWSVLPTMAVISTPTYGVSTTILLELFQAYVAFLAFSHVLLWDLSPQQRPCTLLSTLI